MTRKPRSSQRAAVAPAAAPVDEAVPEVTLIGVDLANGDSETVTDIVGEVGSEIILPGQSETDQPLTVGEDTGAPGVTQHLATEGADAATKPVLDAEHPSSATPETGVDAGGGLGDVVAVVICMVEGGRRRAGRRWPEGETMVREGELDAVQIAQLQGDPRFRIALAPGFEG